MEIKRYECDVWNGGTPRRHRHVCFSVLQDDCDRVVYYCTPACSDSATATWVSFLSRLFPRSIIGTRWEWHDGKGKVLLVDLKASGLSYKQKLLYLVFY